MLYKVTPMMPAPEEAKKAARKAREPGQPRKRRKTAIYDGEGHEVLITLMCLKCKGMKPLAQFGLRKMADGAIRNQPWCRTCRGAAGTKKRGDAEVAVITGGAPAQTPPAPVLGAESEPADVDVAAVVASQAEAAAAPASLSGGSEADAPATVSATAEMPDGAVAESGESPAEAPEVAAPVAAHPETHAEVAPSLEPVAFAAEPAPTFGSSAEDEATHPSVAAESDLHVS